MKNAGEYDGISAASVPFSPVHLLETGTYVRSDMHLSDCH